ncbi:MAG: MFS transporter [Mycobacterium sp.]
MTDQPPSDVSQDTPKAGWLAAWAPLAAVCLTMFIVVLDTSMMNVALPQITRDLKTTVSGVQGAVAMYSLVMAALMLAGAKLGAIHGVRRVFTIALVVYGVGTLLAALSWNLAVLVVGWSFIEGLAAAALLPLSMTLIVTNYSGARRALAFGVLGGVQASAAAIGPIFGGFLTTLLSWRLGFAFEVVIVLAVLALVRFLASAPADRSQRFDGVGALLSFVGLVSIVVGILLAGRYGWWEGRRPFEVAGVEFNLLDLSPTPVLVAVGILVLVGFAHWERHREATGATPLLRLDVLGNSGYVAGFVSDTFQSITLAGILFALPLFLQSALGYDALGAGLVMLPLSVSVLLVSMLTPGLGRMIAPRLLVLLGAIGMVAGALLLEGVAAVDLDGWDLALPLLVFGAGTGLMLAQISNLTLGVVPSDRTTDATGVQNASKELGTALGTAVIGSIFLAGVYAGIAETVLREAGETVTPQAREEAVLQIEDFEASQASAEEKQQFVEELDQQVGGRIDDVVKRANVDGMRNAMFGVSAFAFLAWLVATWLPRERLGRRGESQPNRINPRAGPAPQRGT